MADVGHKQTDDILKKLEKEIAEEYRTATREMEKKLRDYLEQTEAQRKVQEKLWKDGVITKKEYTDWCYRHEMVGKRWEAMRDTLAEDIHRANEIALGITKGKMPDVYALNMNYGTYQIEHDGQIDTGFTLYNHDTANYLLGDQRQLMPKPSAKKAADIAANKDMQWNMRKIQSAVLQGVLQGESPYDVAHRLEQVGQMNYNSAVRYARTMTTSAQNAGRYEAFRRADSLGVKLTIEWQATLDNRTRHDHRLMHGKTTEVNEPFHTPDGYEILYPADCTSGDSYKLQGEIWNCRCTLLSWVKGFEGLAVVSSEKMGDMSFDEWQDEHEDDWKPLQTRTAEEQPKGTSYIERLAQSAMDVDSGEVFGGSASFRFRSFSEDDPDRAIAQSVESTMARLQKDYPLQAGKSWEYKTNLDSLVITDYDFAYIFLPEGENDRRLDDSWGVVAQVFHNSDTATNTDTAVVAFNRALMSADSSSLARDLENRAKAIREGRAVLALAGDSAEATVIHEWGHMYSDHMTTAFINQEPVADEYFSWYKSLPKEDIRMGISDYAATNRGEFEAECFLEMQMPNPRPIAKKWWEYMQKIVAMGY